MDKRKKRTGRVGRNNRRVGRDVNMAAHDIVSHFAAATDDQDSPTNAEVSKVMAMLGRKGGKIGGKRRLVTLTQEERSKIAFKAAQARWAKNASARKP